MCEKVNIYIYIYIYIYVCVCVLRIHFRFTYYFSLLNYLLLFVLLYVKNRFLTRIFFIFFIQKCVTQYPTSSVSFIYLNYLFSYHIFNCIYMFAISFQQSILSEKIFNLIKLNHYTTLIYIFF